MLFFLGFCSGQRLTALSSRGRRRSRRQSPAYGRQPASYSSSSQESRAVPISSYQYPQMELPSSSQRFRQYQSHHTPPQPQPQPQTRNPPYPRDYRPYGQSGGAAQSSHSSGGSGGYPFSSSRGTDPSERLYPARTSSGSSSGGLSNSRQSGFSSSYTRNRGTDK